MKELNKINETEYKKFMSEAEELAKQLGGFIKMLRAKKVKC